MTTGTTDNKIESLLRESAPQALGATVRRYGNFEAAEDAVQEALLAGAMQWPKEGIPESPVSWLIRVAARRMTDRIRSDEARRRREEQAVLQEPIGSDTPERVDRDDTLILLFLCCHPALTPPSAIALTLRAVGGLTTTEIARAFLVPEATMAQRISRAKQRIKDTGASFQLPTPEDRDERLASVLQVLYLIFNEGYTSTIGPDLHRSDLSNEAIRLCRLVRDLLPANGEVAGLLALMLLTDARRPSRTDERGDLIPLAEQDRSLWDQEMIKEGVALITQSLSKGSVGPYQLQAAVAAVHDEAPTVEDTDWAEILALYGLLERMSDNPMVKLNRAIAAGMVHGATEGIKLLDELESDARMTGNHRLDAVRAHLLEMSGDIEGAIASYRLAAKRTTSSPEQRYLATRAALLTKRPGTGAT